jgi:hypothetical protein
LHETRAKRTGIKNIDDYEEQALRAVQVKEAPGRGPQANWARKLAQELLTRQQANGSWANPLVNFREDDPIVATAFGLMALSACRDCETLEATH